MSDKQKDEDEEIDPENNFELNSLYETPILYHFYENGQIYYVINNDGNQIIGTEKDFKTYYIQNYWYNIEELQTNDHLPFVGGDITYVIPPKYDFQNTGKVIFKNNEMNGRYSIVTTQCAKANSNKQYLDFLEQKFHSF